MIEKFGRYEVKLKSTGDPDILGTGGMGIVYRCWDPDIKRVVAVKVDRSPDFRRRLRNEMTLAGGLEHGNIVRVYDVGVEHDPPYLVMELVEGGTLDSMLSGITVERSLRILRDIAHALDFAHSKSVIHRDVKPSNILVANDGTAKLLDFGVAELLQPGSETETDGVVGTRPFIAPDLLNGTSKPSPASDQYSLAVLAYRMFTGFYPPEGKREPASKANATLPSGADSALARGLAEFGTMRHATCTEFVDAIVGVDRAGSKSTAKVPRTILHLSDLHFGRDHAQRTAALDALCDTLKALDKSWKPDILVISGDLTWKGRPEGYSQLTAWLTTKLFPATGLNAAACVVCPGNHDVDRKKARLLPSASSTDEADEFLRPAELDDGFARPFAEFTQFATALGIPAPKLLGESNALAGVCEFRGVRFVCLNSAWFSRKSSTDQGQLWLGLPQLLAMPLMDPVLYDTEPPTIAVIHHPPEWLAAADRTPTTNRPNPYFHLAERAHIILSGHSPGVSEHPKPPYDRAHLFVGGAAYDGDAYRSSFSILRLDQGKLTRRVWEWNSAEPAWKPKPERSHSLLAGNKGPACDPSKYLSWLRTETGSIKLEQLGLARTDCPPPAIDKLYFRSTTAAKALGDRLERSEPVPLQERLADHRLVIEGGPGSGKTTFVRWVAWNLCRPDGAPPGFPVQGFPIWVRISELDQHIAATLAAPQRGDPTGPVSKRWIPHFLASQDWGLDEEFFQRRLGERDTVLLLDGLDEAANQERREHLVAMMGLSAAQYACHIVVTTRPGAYQGRSTLEGFEKAPIHDLDYDGIKAFLLRWCRWLKYPDELAAHDYLTELLQAVSVSAIRILACNPLMLTALAVLHLKRHRLPEQRAQLYEQIMDWLADQAVEKHPGAWRKDDLLREFGDLALAMQQWKGGRRRELGIDDAAQALTKEDQRIDDKRQFIEKAQLDSGIVTLQAGQLRFWHLSFQEYLAARTLAGFTDAKLMAAAKKVLYSPEDREVLPLLAGRMERSARDRLDKLFEKLIGDALKKRQLERQAHAVGVLANMLADLKPTGYPLSAAAALQFERLRGAVMAIFTKGGTIGIGLKTRVAAAEALDQASQSRLYTPDRPGYWVEIPADTYPIGGDSKAYRSLPAQRVTLPSFRIGRFPVTVWEYGAYLDDSGAKPPGKWDEQAQHPSRPVIWVTWYDAQHYCEWASLKWNIQCMLATEEQWEAAARGRDGRVYPWGKEEPDEHRANFDRGVGAPTPVGMFPDGDTPEGVADMAGNVWEWTSSDYDEKTKCVRGASYYNDASGLRAANRFRVVPGGSGSDIGFRCVGE